jgi:hypothetical protein
VRKLALCILCLLLAGQTTFAEESAEAPVMAIRGEVPFRLFGGYLIVMEGTIGTLQGLKFVLDTGVTYSMIDRKLADQLALLRKSGKIVNFDKTAAVEWATVPEIRVGPIRLGPEPVMVGELSYFQSFATHVDAVIGLDILARRSFTIDFAEKKIRFGRSEPERFSTPLSARTICLTVEVKTGDQTLRLIPDSGAQGIVLYEERLLDRQIRYQGRGEIMGVSVGGHVRSKIGFMPRLQLGGREMDREVFLTESPHSNALAGIDGYLGLGTLHARRINFDFESNTLSWTN